MDQSSKNNAIAMVAVYLDKKVRITNEERLNTQSGIYVYRIWVKTEDDKSISFIYKEFLPQNAGSDEFLKYKLSTEIFNYQFLMSVRDQFDHFPILFHSSESVDALLIEDLGASKVVIDDSYLERLLTCFARLYAATKGRKKNYITYKRYLELTDEQHLVFLEQNQIAAKLAIKQVIQYMEATKIEGTTEFIKLLNHVIEQVNRPNELFTSFIHYDFIDGRQAVVRGDKIYLLDFEMARFSHPLLEIAVLLMGKIEVDLDMDKRCYFNLSISNNIIENYKKKIEELISIKFDYNEWNHEMGNCLIYHALSLIKQREIGLPKMHMHSFLFDLKTIIERLLYCLEPIESHSDLKNFFKKIHEKIIV